MKYMLAVTMALPAAAVAGPAAAEFGKAPAPAGFQAPKRAGTGFTSRSTDITPYKSHYTAPYSPAVGSVQSTMRARAYGTPPTAERYKVHEPYKAYEPYKSQPGTSMFGPDGRKKR